MSISFNSIKTHKNLTLPSVEAGFGTLNIFRDPPKSIHTRKIDKVGANSDITRMIDAGDDRVSEAINVYARGTNPFVSVSYSNYSNNGGQSALARSGQANASLPYKVAIDGAFRPPVIPPTELVALSRQPRLTTQAVTNPEAINYTQKAMCPAPETMKQVRKRTLEKKADGIKPTARYFIEKSGINTIKTDNYVLNEPIKVAGYAGKNTQQKADVLTSRSANKQSVRENIMLNTVVTNPGAIDKAKKVTATLNTDKYINENLTKRSAVTNPHVNQDKNIYVQDKIELVKNIPNYNYTSAPSRSGQGDFYSVNGRSVKLTPKRKAEGSIETFGTLPQTQRTAPKVRFNDTQYNRRKQIASMQHARY